MKRSEQISKLKKDLNFDVVVIGGGASGLGTALDSTTRGYKTALFEVKDFAKATSSRATKLVHGGVRYLAQGDVALVREALRERGRLAQNAAHLVKNQTFIIPNYSFFNQYKYLIGMKLYDMLAGKLSLGKSIGYSKKVTGEKLSTVRTNGLYGGVEYRDGQFDDSRLAVNLAQTIIEKGGVAVNYTKVIGILKDANGKTSGVKVVDELSGEEFEVNAKVVFNATGVFINEILNMDNPKHGKMVVPSQGVHLVLDRSFLPGDDALMIPETSDGRVLFAVPWHNKLIVGTTDTPIEEESFEPKALDTEIDFILETAAAYLTKKVTREDILSIFAGLRPLAAPSGEGKSTKEVSRSHKIVTSDSGLISIIGGKWTTYRQMAEDMMDKAIALNMLPKKECKTVDLSIHGNLPVEQVDRTNHLYIYGSDIPAIKKVQQESPAFTEKVHPNYPYTIAEVVWAAREEMAESVEDILARRVRLLFLDARAAIDSATKVGQILAKELGKDDAWAKKSADEFISIAKGYLLVDYTPKN